MFILLLATIYLTAIYGVLKIAARLPQEESSSYSLNRTKFRVTRYSTSLKALIYIGYTYREPYV